MIANTHDIRTIHLAEWQPLIEYQGQVVPKITIQVPDGWRVAGTPFPTRYPTHEMQQRVAKSMAYGWPNTYQWNRFALVRSTDFSNRQPAAMIIHPVLLDNRTPYVSISSFRPIEPEGLLGPHSPIFDSFLCKEDPSRVVQIKEIKSLTTATGQQCVLAQRTDTGNAYGGTYHRLIAAIYINEAVAIGFCLLGVSQADIGATQGDFERLITSLNLAK